MKKARTKKPRKKIVKKVAKKTIRKSVKKITRKRAIKKPVKKPRKPRRRIGTRGKPKVKKIARKKTIKRRKTTKKKPVKKIKKRTPKKKPIRRPRKRIVKKKAKPKKRKVVRRRKPIKKRAIKKPRKRVIKKRVVKRKPKRKKTRRAKRTYSTGGSLEQLFESSIKIQVMKLFFRNPENNFLLKEAAKIMKVNLALVRKEMKKLEKIGLLKTRQISPRKQLFAINPNFDFFNELRELILKASPVSKEKMLKAIRGLGKIKLVLLSGLFVGEETSRADLLIVGDNINQRKLAGFIKNLEAQAGTNINCAVMTTEEFGYRYDMYDRFVRDLLNEKCEFLINRLGV